MKYCATQGSYTWEQVKLQKEKYLICGFCIVNRSHIELWGYDESGLYVILDEDRWGILTPWVWHLQEQYIFASVFRLLWKERRILPNRLPWNCNKALKLQRWVYIVWNGILRWFFSNIVRTVKILICSVTQIILGVDDFHMFISGL